MMRWACRRLRPALVDRAAGAIEPDDARALDAHLAGCPACRDDLAALRSLTHELAAAPVAELPDPDFWRRQRQAIMRRVRTAPAPAPAARDLHWPAWRIAGVIATVVLAFLVGRSTFVPRAMPHAVERLDDDALAHLHDLLPAIAPASTIEDADSDMLAIHDLGEDELDRLAELLGDAS